MATTYKVLGQSAPSATTATTLYTVPAATSTVVSSISVVNTHASTNDVINVQQIGAGQTSFAAGAGVTITSTGASSAAPKLRAQYSSASVICSASNTFTIVGDIA